MAFKANFFTLFLSVSYVPDKVLMKGVYKMGFYFSFHFVRYCLPYKIIDLAQIFSCSCYEAFQINVVLLLKTKNISSFFRKWSLWINSLSCVHS